MFQLETDLRGVSITQMDRGQNEKNHSCTFMYAMYKRARPIPDKDQTADNRLTLWTKPFVTRNFRLRHLSLWEPGVLYRLPQVALDELCEGDDLCAAPVHIEFTHTPYAALTVDEYRRASADADPRPCTTALHIGAYTPCIVAPRDEVAGWVDYIGRLHGFFPFLLSGVEERELPIDWLRSLFSFGDVHVEHLPGLLDRPVGLIRERVSRETA